MAATMPDALASDAEVDAFQRDGVLVLRGLFVHGIDALRRGVESDMANQA